MDHTDRLKIISQAWGRQEGFCFFPWIDGTASNREERIKSYHEGPAFEWPGDRAKIIDHLAKHWNDDLYWCPSLFEHPRRRLELAMDECALWADLDEVNPRAIQDYPPTVAWETSPNHYQALWLVSPGQDLQGASWAGGENQRLTSHLSADQGGWDTTQLLRLPEWPNHKPERVEANGGVAPVGKLLWKSRRRYLPDEFEDLPRIQDTGPMQDILEDQVEAVNRREVWAKVRLKLTSGVRELMAAREATGDRSETAWRMEREFADAGCTVPEIVALIRSTPWNKYVGRQDELKRLVAEASKAIAARSPEASKVLEAQRDDMPKPKRLSLALVGVKPVRWLVKEVWSEAGVGFIAGQPKSYKSWFALDLALSVGTGTPFLGHEEFKVERIAPVLYIQEEDSLPTVKSRHDKMWPDKKADSITIIDGEVIWRPAAEMEEAMVDVVIREGLTLSDPVWQAWLDDVLAEGSTWGLPYGLVVLDPYMMMAGDVDEHRSGEVMGKVLGPLKDLSEKHGTALCMVHHMKKGGDDNSTSQRGGQMMLGSTAFHAWAHDALYVTHARGGVNVERENKDANRAKFTVSGLSNQGWTPTVSALRDFWETAPNSETSSSWERDKTPQNHTRRPRGRPSKVEAALKQLGPGVHTVKAIQLVLDTGDDSLTYAAVYQKLQRLEKQGLIRKMAKGWLVE